MDVTPITLDREKARELYRAYKTHAHYSTPIDDEVRRAYQLLAQGRLIIRALDSVRAAGLGDDGYPKLAISHASAAQCRAIVRSDGSVTMTDDARSWRRSNASPKRWFDWPAGSFPGAVYRRDGIAIMPSIPLHLRPKRGIENYHILWEAEWNRIVPKDPYLLRRIGRGDMWLVVAMWDLTEIERTALSARIGVA